MSHHIPYTEKRRARLRKAVDRIERLESRTTITEPISVLALSVSALRGLAQLGIVQLNGGGDALARLAAARRAAQQRGQGMTAAPIQAVSPAANYLPIVVGSEQGPGLVRSKRCERILTDAGVRAADG